MKKTLSFILALVMVAAMFAVVAMPASAADEPAAAIVSDTYDGTPDTSWFDAADIKDEYTLTTAEQLAGLAQIVNTNTTEVMAKPFDGVTIKLGADIIWNEGIVGINEYNAPTYNGAAALTVVDGNVVLDTTKIKEWPVIGTRPGGNNTIVPGATHFYGNIDGQGHVISGLVANTSGAYTSFISIFAGNYIKNLSIVNSYFGCEWRSGAFVGFVANADTKAVEFENLYTNAIVNFTNSNGNARSGGMFGMMRKVNDISMKNLWFDGTINALCKDDKTNAPFVGGLVGVICEENDEEKITIDSCLVTGTINGQIASDGTSVAVGGLIANIYSNERKTAIEVTVKNSLVAVESTNLVVSDTLSQVARSAFIGRFEKSYATYTLENSYFIPQGVFGTGNTVHSVVAGWGAHEYVEPGFKNDKKADTLTDVTFNGTLIAEANTLPATETLATAKIAKFTEATGLSADTFALTETSAAIKGLRTCLAECVYGELIAEVPASCDGDGMKAHYECGICGKLYDDKKAEVAEADLVIPAAHDYGEWKAPVDASLDAAGVLGHYECSKCHKYFDADKNELASIVGDAQLTTPVVTTTQKPADNTTKPAATTAAPDEGGCGGFTAIGAVLALVALTGAAVVIKKK